MKNKIELRLFAKKQRQNLNINSISKSILVKIKTLDVFISAKNIMLFYPLENEINLLPLLKTEDKNFFLPRMTENKSLECCPFSLEDELIEKKFCVKEPLTKACSKCDVDLIIAPALCVDYKGNRLGYGAGFYDRFFEDINCTKIVPISDTLILENIPTDAFDKKIDIIISEKRIIKINNPQD